MYEFAVHAVIVVAISVVVGLFFIIYDGLKSRDVDTWMEKENYYLSVKDEEVEFPSLYDRGSIYLSVIVPSYNEESRLPKMLDEALDVLKKMKKEKSERSFEIIVVDDGSTDKTSDVALKYRQEKRLSDDVIRVLTLKKNRGKGGAVRRGMLCSRGKLVLFADADGASKFSEIHKLLNSMEKNTLDGVPKSKRKEMLGETLFMCIGSRAHLEEESIAERKFYRTVLMYMFHLLVSTFCVKGVKDTQCGFKLFTRKTAQILFPMQHVERWAFDAEILFLSSALGVEIDEIQIAWEEIDGSKLTLYGMAVMGKDLIRIWLMYQLGVWKLPKITN